MFNDKYFQRIQNKFDVYLKENNEKNESDDKFVATVKTNEAISNVVTAEKLRIIQSGVLKVVKDFLINTYGPMGSNTKIITGNDINNISSMYSKDGLNVLKNIKFSGPIEASIVEELIDITRKVESKVGDGTTSTVILSSFIFDKLNLIQNHYKIPPHELIDIFESVVYKIKSIILSNTKECTKDDIYDISMISTNSNEEVSQNIKTIYENYGNDVDISVGISNSSDNIIKIYDGLTVTEGMSDPAYINNRTNNTCEIHNAYIYHFEDPIDTMDMIGLFEAIIEQNILEPLRSKNTLLTPIPTVICTPKISKDAGSILKKLCSTLYLFDKDDSAINKPPICVITDLIASDELIMNDIANLCGCKGIKKYIDPELWKKDVENGSAATIDTVADFAGRAELVIADSKKTKFINPQHMYTESGEEDPIYTSMINFLETEIKEEEGKSNSNEIGLLKKRLSALKGNIVDYLVGGVTISERDALKDLVEDAIKNCRSASKYGVGYAANFEALRASYSLSTEFENLSDIEKDIVDAIASSYYEAAHILYSTCSNFDPDTDIYYSLKVGYPFNIKTGKIMDSPGYEEYNKAVKCSIMLDVEILNTISRIISMMVTCNQCLLQAPQLNRY